MGDNLGRVLTPNSKQGYGHFTFYGPYHATTQSSYQFYNGGRHLKRSGRHCGLGGRVTNRQHKELLKYGKLTTLVMTLKEILLEGKITLEVIMMDNRRIGP